MSSGDEWTDTRDEPEAQNQLTEEDEERWRQLHDQPLNALSDAEITSKIRLSIKRRFDYPEWVVMFEYGAPGNSGSVADALAVNTLPSRNYKLIAFEFKASRSDWKREKRDGQKADYFVRMADEFYLVAPKGVVEEAEIPDGWGYLELKPNSEQLYKLRESDLTNHQVGEPDRRFWVRLIKETAGADTNYTQRDLDEARSRGYDEALNEATNRKVDRNLDRLERKAENWDTLTDSPVGGMLPSYSFDEADLEMLEQVFALVKRLEQDHVGGSFQNNLDMLEKRIGRSAEAMQQEVTEMREAVNALQEQVGDGQASLPDVDGGGADGNGGGGGE